MLQGDGDLDDIMKLEPSNHHPVLASLSKSWCGNLKFNPPHPSANNDLPRQSDIFLQKR